MIFPTIKDWSHKLLVKVPKGSFARGLGLLLGGSIAGQAIALLFSPIITRLYTPSDFGAMGVYVSLLGILTVGAMLRYEVAIPGADTEEEALALLGLCAVVAFFTSFCVTIVFFLARPFVIHIRNVREIWSYRYLLTFGMFTTACYAALSFWSVRRRDYSLLSRTKITQSTGLVGTQLGLGFTHFGALGLIISQVIGQSAGSGSILRSIVRTSKTELRQVGYHSLKKAGIRYHRFPKLSFPATLLEACSNNLPLLFMASFYSTTVAGWITLVQRMIFMPMTLLGNNVMQVFYGELAEMKRDSPERLRRAYVSRLKQFSKLSFAGALPIAALAPFLIPLIFGQAWRNSVICLELLIPPMVIAFIARPFGCALDVLERQDLHLIRDSGRLLITLTALGLSYLLKLEWRGALVLISFAGCIGSLFYLWLSWISIRDYHLVDAIQL